ncbi:MAG: sigma-70 family RNA polymerase sigma factor [Hyphomicrobiaceae bacterium]|nr:sigma-70 family RNA polymerase sigma factor [Hyphomicrobiaceae bacterium]
MSEPVPAREAMVELIPSLRAFAVSLCGDLERADDLVQDTLLKAWNHLGSFQEGTNLRAWLFTILRNTYYSDRRRRLREVEDDGTWALSLAVHPDQEGHVDVQDFCVALKDLPAEQREALILVGAAGFSYEEAAQISSCAVGTIKSRVNRARARLAETMAVTNACEFGPDAATEAIVAHSARNGGR